MPPHPTSGGRPRRAQLAQQSESANCNTANNNLPAAIKVQRLLASASAFSAAEIASSAVRRPTAAVRAKPAKHSFPEGR